MKTKIKRHSRSALSIVLHSKYVTSVYDYAFMDNETISSIDFSGSYLLGKVGTKSFCGCSALTGSVTLPAVIEELGLGAFQECGNLQKITVNGFVTVIPEQCCYKDSSLTEVNLPTNLERIEKLAFAECPALQDIYIPDTVNYIHPSAFSESRGVVLNCMYGSYAYNYAVENNVNYRLLDNVKLGDTDGDDYVNINDVTQIQRHLAELESLEGIYLHVADVNQDGIVDISDATAIQMYLAEYDIPYPIGEVMTQ